MASRQVREARERRSVDATAFADKAAAGGFERTSVKLLPDMEVWNPKKGVFEVDIIPYDVGKGNPDCAEGGYFFCRSYYVHKGLGIDGRDTYCCLSGTFGEKCPICEKVEIWGEDPKKNKDLLDDFRRKQRQLFNVFVFEEPKKGVQVWDISLHLFGKLLGTKIGFNKGKYGKFADADKGFTLRLGFVEKSLGSGTYGEVKDIEFLERKPLDDKVLDLAWCLDNLLIKTPYARLKDIFLQKEDSDSGASDRNGDEPAPRGRGRGTDDADAPAPRGRGREVEDDDAPRGRGRAAEDDTPPAPRGRGRDAADEDAPRRGRSTEDDDAPRGRGRGTDDADAPAPRGRGREVEEPAPRGGKKDGPTAEEAGLKKGDMVIYKKGNKTLECEIVKISGDGTSLTLNDDDGKDYTAVAPSEVEKKEVGGKKEAKEEEAPRARGGRGRDEGDSPPAPRGRGRAAEDDDAPRGRGRAADDEDAPRGRSRGSDDDIPFRDRDRNGDDEAPRGRSRGTDDEDAPAPRRGRG